MRGIDRYFYCGSDYNTLRFQKGKILIPSESRKGYLRVRISKSRKEKYSLPIHRLVAKAFIPNPNNLPQVNHIDGNKKNNYVNNLEWCDNSYNQIHASALGLNNHLKYDTGRKKVAQVSDNYIINIFDSMAEAARKTDSFRELIGKCCRKERISHNGYKWIFATEDMKVGDAVSFN